MSKKYTAQEMRHRADEEQYLWNDSTTAAMLRQAADAMDRETREKKYEYAVRYKNGELSCLRHTEPFRDEDVAAADCICVRRAVGECEEVK